MEIHGKAAHARKSKPVRARDPRTAEYSASVATRERIIDSTENMLANGSINGASLAQLAATLGQADAYAIRHHFADKARAVSEILRIRYLNLDGIDRPLRHSH